MTTTLWIAAIVALVAGIGIGGWLGRRGQHALRERLAQAERELAAQQARAAEAARALQAKAAKDLQDARAAWEVHSARGAAEHHAEIERLTLHLSQACDEVDRLRAAAARRAGGPDTGQGFAATLPLGDV